MQNQTGEGEVFLVNKPLQWTSFDVVRKLKNILKAKKIGHAGTLDPLATGLLVVCTERKTKTIQFIQDAEKEYSGTFYLGATTPSFDLETEVDERFETGHITPELLQETLKNFIGEIEQVPPMHSAVKFNGERAYKIARRGDVAELRSKNISIKVFEITRFELPEIDFRIVCSKGTYIRSLARDLGLALGSGAHLTALSRDRIGDFLLSKARTIEQFMHDFPSVNSTIDQDKS
jgi:tRNA pseudouridine55 synthase